MFQIYSLKKDLPSKLLLQIIELHSLTEINFGSVKMRNYKNKKKKSRLIRISRNELF